MSDTLNAKKFAVITNKNGKSLLLMSRAEWNAGEVGIFICKGEDALGQLLEGRFICYMKDWPNYKKRLESSGVTIKEL